MINNWCALPSFWSCFFTQLTPSLPLHSLIIYMWYRNFFQSASQITASHSMQLFDVAVVHWIFFWWNSWLLMKWERFHSLQKKNCGRRFSSCEITKIFWRRRKKDRNIETKQQQQKNEKKNTRIATVDDDDDGDDYFNSNYPCITYARNTLLEVLLSPRKIILFIVGVICFVFIT